MRKNIPLIKTDFLALRALGSIVLCTAVALAVAAPKSNADTSAAPVDVTLSHHGSSYTLLRDGKPFFIKGAGGSASKAELKLCGGNSIRTWGADTLGDDLDDSQKNGLAVSAGIWLGHTDQGFNYADPGQLAAQRATVHDTVLEYRNHPALLIWSIGNEMEGNGSNTAIWQQIESLAKMVKQLDPHHPVMTVICEPIDKKIKELNDNCPDVDIVGINAYASAPTIAKRYIAAGGVKPYILTEYGPPGQWEQPTTTWGASLEMTSTAKADWYRRAYVSSVQNQPLCLGSYAFLWGNKQEATATWYGMVLPTGERLEAADMVSSFWNGQPYIPAAPQIGSFKVDGSTTVQAGAAFHVALNAKDPSDLPMEYSWVVRSDRKALANGGQAESPLSDIPGTVAWTSDSGAEITAPTDPGSYRVFVYLRNQKGDAAVANIPFLVSPQTADTDTNSSTTGNGLFQTASTDGSKVPAAHLPYSLYGPEGKASLIYIPSGYMGNTDAIKMDPANLAVHGHAGGPSLKASYTASSNWGGVVWQSPVNDWGDAPGGLNLTGAKKLTFWARGADGGEVVSFQYGLIAADKHYHDSSSGKLPNVTLTTQWTEYSIDLADKNLSDIKTAFVWTVAANGKPVTFYLDDIRYE